MTKVATPDVVAKLVEQGMSYSAIAQQLAKKGYKNSARNAVTAQNIRRIARTNTDTVVEPKPDTVVEPKPDTVVAAANRALAAKRKGTLTWEDVPHDLRADVVREIADRLLG